MVAGGTIGRADLVTVNPEFNLNAIDLEVGVVLRSHYGIYLQELVAGGDLTIGSVAATVVTVRTCLRDVEFRSTRPAP